MSKPMLCAFGSKESEMVYCSGYAANSRVELIQMICDDGGCPNDFYFFRVGDPLQLVLEEIENEP